MCTTALGVGGKVAVGATCDPGQYGIDHLVETNTHQPTHPICNLQPPSSQITTTIENQRKEHFLLNSNQ